MRVTCRFAASGELEQYEGAPNPSVGFIIDDIDFSGIGSIATLFDLQQIEILRGPQGSRYGANALAGLVYVQSAEPTDAFSGTVRLGAGGDNALTAGMALGGPIGGAIAALPTERAPLPQRRLSRQFVFATQRHQRPR